MQLSVPTVLRRIETISLEHGVAYPWWMPLACKSGQIIGAIVALVQRDQLPSWQFAVVMALLLGPMAIEFGTGRWLPVWMRLVPSLAAYTVIAVMPQTAGSGLDAIAVMLTMIVADYAARDGWRGGLSFAAVAAVPVIILTHADQLLVSLLFLAVGFEGGFMVHWIARALAAEREARDEAYARATLAERDRIAREIHDLVAHSLSVTMLHVTAARRMVDDGDDPAEVVAALSDAELVGRRAMTDIRQTVSGMSSRQPLPTAGDLPQLIEHVSAAGQSVTFALHGDPDTLPDAVGLGLYRVAQESLANAAKHAAGSASDVRLDITGGEARLRIRNASNGATHGAGHGDGLGSGIAGMRARIDQLGGRLSAGRSSTETGDDAWIVDAVVPLKACVRSAVRSALTPRTS